MKLGPLKFQPCPPNLGQFLYHIHLPIAGLLGGTGVVCSVLCGIVDQFFPVYRAVFGDALAGSCARKQPNISASWGGGLVASYSGLYRLCLLGVSWQSRADSSLSLACKQATNVKTLGVAVIHLARERGRAERRGVAVAAFTIPASLAL